MFTSKRHGCVFCTKDLFFCVFILFLSRLNSGSLFRGLVKHNTLEIWFTVGFLLPGSGVFILLHYIDTRFTNLVHVSECVYRE